MKAIDFTLYNIDTAIRGYRDIPRDMSEVAKTVENAFDVLYDQLMKAIGRTMEDIERAQKDRSIVKEAIKTTEAAIEKLQAVADAPAPEGEEKSPPPKELGGAKKNLARLKAIKKEIDSTIRQLETQLYQQKLNRDYLLNAYGSFNNTYNFQLTHINGVVTSANKAADAAHRAMNTLGAGEFTHMECESPTYLTRAAVCIDTYARDMETQTRDLSRATAYFAAHLQDNVSRKATAATKDIHRTLKQNVEKTKSHSGKLRQAAQYLDTYLRYGI